MTEQEKLQQEELAVEALENISGGALSKKEAQQYLKNAKKFGKKHWGKITALALTLLGVGIEYKRGGQDLTYIKDLLAGDAYQQDDPDAYQGDPAVPNGAILAKPKDTSNYTMHTTNSGTRYWLPNTQ